MKSFQPGIQLALRFYDIFKSKERNDKDGFRSREMNLPMSITSKDDHTFEKRTRVDRRQRKTPLFSKYSLTGRRATRRRTEDRLTHFIPDRHSPKSFAVILVIIMLSIADAVLTLELISHGASELNPIMAYYLEHGPLVFFWMKYLLTFAAIILILFHEEIYLFKDKVQVKALYFFLIIPFALVVCWELLLIQTLD